VEPAKVEGTIIAVCGGTCSGKSTFCESVPGAAIVHIDDFYKELSLLTPREDGTYDFEDPSSIDLDECAAVCLALAAGKAAEIPNYDTISDSSVGSHTVAPPENGIVFVEGIFAFEQPIYGIASMKVFLDVPDEVRVTRRITRDVAMGLPILRVLKLVLEAETAFAERKERLIGLADRVLQEADAQHYQIEHLARPGRPESEAI
jgi:uridine kinase